MASKTTQNGKNGSNGHGITISKNGEARFHGLEIAAVIPKARRGPKGFVFPVEMAETFGELGMTHQEIADLFGITRMSVEREFAKDNKSDFVTAYKRGYANLRQNLRRHLITRAADSDAALIFALKNYCGMRDKHEVEHAGEVQVNVTMGGKAFKRPPKWLKEN